MRPLLTSLIAVALAFPLGAQSALVNHELSGPMVSRIASDVGEFTLSPRGDRVSYRVSSPLHLEVAASDGSGAPVSLTGEQPSIDLERWTPDASRVLYWVSQGATREIRVVPSDGSAAPTALVDFPSGQTLGQNYDGDRVQLTADGSRMVFLREDSFQPVELWSVPVFGGTPERLSVPGAGVASFLVSGATVVYRGGNPPPTVKGDLFSVPADGSAPPINLTQVASFPESVLTWEGVQVVIDPSGTRAVYKARPGSPTLYSVFVDGSAPPARLSAAPQLPGSVTSFRVSPDASHVVYRADEVATDRFELFLAPIDASAPTVPLVMVAPGDSVSAGYEFSPDGAYVVYRTGTGYFSVRVSDGAIVSLHPGNADFQITPDSSRAVFLATGARELYSARLDGTTAAVRINPEFVTGGQVRVTDNEDGFAISPDSQRLVYRADAEAIDVLELYWVPIVPSGPPTATKLNATLPVGADVSQFAIASDSTSVLYLAQEIAGITELFRAPEQVAINDPITTLSVIGDAHSFAVQSGRVVYVADQEDDEVDEIFGVPADGSAPPVRLDGSLVSGGDVDTDFELSPDGSTAVYTADAEMDGMRELYSVPSDGSALPVKLNGPLASSTSVGGSRISPNGARVVYEAFHASTPGFRLYSVQIHGGTPVLLGPDPEDLAITPDSTRVVFSTGGGLWSVPIDGSAAAIQLSGAVTSILEFAITPDSTRVVYRSGSLYSASVLGGTPVDLSGPLVSGGSVTGFALSVGGERVVYRADRFVDERFLLSSVPVEGGASIVLNGPLVAGGDVSDFQVSPAGTYVVYRADQEVDNDDRLHRVHVDGSAPPVLLNGQDLDLAPFAIAPDGAHLVVSLDGLQVLPITGGSLVELSSSASTFLFTDGGQRVLHVEAERLKLTPIEGGRSETLNPPPAGTLWDFALDGSRRVVYRAAQEQDSVIEIYSSLLQPIESTPLAPPGRPIRR